VAVRMEIERVLQKSERATVSGKASFSEGESELKQASGSELG